MEIPEIVQRSFEVVMRAELPPVARQRNAERPGFEEPGFELLASVDAAARTLPALALEHGAMEEAAAALRGLPPVVSSSAAREVMMATERVGRAFGAAPALLKASGGAASTLLLVERAGTDEVRLEAAGRQVAFAVLRVVGMVLKDGVDGEDVCRALTGGG